MFRYAKFRYFQLSYAELSHAELSHAELSYAELSYAEFSYVELCWSTNFRAEALTISYSLDRWVGGCVSGWNSENKAELKFELINITNKKVMKDGFR